MTATIDQPTSVDQRDATAEIPARLLIASAELALRLGHTAEVHAAACQLLLRYPYALVAQLLRGQLLIEQEDDRLALPHFARVSQAHPLEPTAWLGLALSQRARGDERAAELAMLRARELAPLDGSAEYDDQEPQQPLTHALLALRSGQNELAVLSLRRLRREADRPELALLEAEGLRRLGEHEAARQLFGTLSKQLRSSLPGLLLRAALLGADPRASRLWEQIAGQDLDGRFSSQWFVPQPIPWQQAEPLISWPDRPGMLLELASQLPEQLHALPATRRPQPKSAGAAPVRARRSLLRSLADPAVAELASTVAAERGRLLSRSGIKPLQPWPAAERSVQLLVTSKQALLRKYGEAGYEAIEARLQELSAALRDRAVTAELCLVDEQSSLRPYPGLAPVPAEAAPVAGLLHGIERQIAQRGAALKIVLLIGGDDVLPFHRLPNESDDADGPTLSDLPYGGGDSAQVLPRWSVARLPDGPGPRPYFLLHLLDQMISYHRGWQAVVAQGHGCLFPGLGRLRRSRAPLPGQPTRAFGLSASVWREASEAIYAPLKSERALRLSPPEQLETFRPDWLIGRRLLYFNLHGAHGSPNWYGEASWDAQDEPRLPVVLTPESFSGEVNGMLVVSEACYGAEISGRSADNAIALRLLDEGALAFVGSTVTAYGAPSPPLAAADLFTARLCQRLAAGEPAALACHAARNDFIREVYQQHGFMDGDDLKTLQSFVLYGDPWASLAAEPVVETSQPKSAPALPFLARERHPVSEGQLPKDLLHAVRQRLAKLLPGAPGQLSVAVEPLGPGGAKGPGGERQALVFNAEQQAQAQDGRLLTHVAHLTLVRAKLVKTVVSR